MTVFTEAGLRAALREEADKTGWEPQQAWPVIRRRIVRQRRYRAGTAVLAAAAVAGLVAGDRKSVV